MDFCQVTEKPDKAEARQIIIRYSKAAAVILCNIILFNVVLQIPRFIIGGFVNSFESLSAMKAGWASYSASHELIRMIFSVGIPIVSECCSIILGVMLLKLDLKKLFTRDGYNGGTVVKSAVSSIALQTAAGFLVLIITTLLSRFNLQSETASVVPSQSSAATTIVLLFYASFGAPVLEELLYRGVLLQGLRRYNERFAIVMSALIFGLMHQNYQQCILGILIGLLFGAITIKTGSIVPTIICHFIVNGSSALTTLIISFQDPSVLNVSLTNIPSTFEFMGNTGLMVTLMLNALLRFGSMLAALVWGIMLLVRGTGLNRPTPAGKSRSWSLLLRTALWYIVFAAYAYLTFIEPMSKIS